MRREERVLRQARAGRRGCWWCWQLGEGDALGEGLLGRQFEGAPTGYKVVLK